MKEIKREEANRLTRKGERKNIVIKEKIGLRLTWGRRRGKWDKMTGKEKLREMKIRGKG